MPGLAGRQRLGSHQVVVQGRQAGESADLSVVAAGREVLVESGQTFVIGRGPHADLAIDDPHVSREHLVLHRQDGGWVLRDASRSGTFAEGRRLAEARIDGPLSVRLGDADNGPIVELCPLSRDRAATQHVPSIELGPPPVSRPKTATGLGRLSGVHPALRTHVRLGRATDNDLLVDDLLVSRHHAEMTHRRDGTWELVDLESDNGTFVNGRRIERRVLEPLDVVTLGHHAFRLTEAGLEEYVDEGRVAFEAVRLRTRAPTGQVLLDGVTFGVDERSLLAVVGPSGSGKSTLLGALTGFRPAQEGAVLYGGRDLYAEYDALRTRIGFVPQQDIVHHPLTVDQALSYAAELRFSADVARDERRRRVTEVIDELGLADARHTPVGSLSGGQRRRACVGLELITKPTLLFLDEPTSGLDPGYERSLMLQLRALADGGRTVVVVTHSVQSLRLCDRVLFLAPGGRTAYFGPAQLAPAYFGCEDFQEIFALLAAHREHDWAGAFRDHPYHERYVEQPIAHAAEPVAPARRRTLPALPSPRGWLAQVSMLTRRYLRVVTSDRRNLALLILQPILLGLLMLAALPAHELGAPAEGELRVVSRAGLVLLVVVLGATWVGASNAIREVVKERAILSRERAVGLSVSAYVLSKFAVLGAITAVQATVLVAIATARQGGPSEGSFFGSPTVELIAAAVLAGLAAMALALFISSAARTVDRAMTVLPVVLIVQMLLAMGGLFPDIVDKPVLKQASYVASTQWAFSATASTVDLDRLQSVDRLARDLPTVRLDDPTPVLRALSEPGETERQWRHDWPTWLANAGALMALTLAGVVASMLALVRRRPEG